MIELLAMFAIVGVIFLALTAYSSVSWGLVVFKFWAWFVVPAITVLPAITLPEAIGVALFISLFRNHGTSGIKKEYTNQKDVWSQLILAPWITLLCGWIVKAILL